MPTLQIFNYYTHPDTQGGRPTPALSLDIHPKERHRFATGGGDTKVVLWSLKTDLEEGIEKVAELIGHQKPVNVVRWNSSGSLLGTAGDDGSILLWELDQGVKPIQSFGSNEVLKETWSVNKKLRSSFTEVADFCWHPEQRYLCNVSPTGIAYIWDLKSAKIIQELKVGAQYIQGVVWSPSGHQIALQTTDPNLVLFARKGTQKFSFEKVADIISIKLKKRPRDEDDKGNSRKGPFEKDLFFGNILRNHTKRPGFSPCGRFVIGSGGRAKRNGREVSAIHVHETSKPKGWVTTYWIDTQLPVTDVKFNPRFFPLAEPADEFTSVAKQRLKYTLVVACLVESGVYFFDLSRKHALYYWRDSDVESYTDLSWDPTGTFCLLTDNEGFVSKLDFFDDFVGGVESAWLKKPKVKKTSPKVFAKKVVAPVNILQPRRKSEKGGK